MCTETVSPAVGYKGLIERETKGSSACTGEGKEHSKRYIPKKERKGKGSKRFNTTEYIYTVYHAHRYYSKIKGIPKIKKYQRYRMDFSVILVSQDLSLLV